MLENGLCLIESSQYFIHGKRQLVIVTVTIWFRAARYSKINLDIVLSCPNTQGHNPYNIYIQFSIQYQDCGVKNVKNLVLS